MQRYDAETNERESLKPPESDEVVIERVRGGDTRSYETIMRRYNQRLFRAARSILLDDDVAQDAVQEAYVSAYYKLDKYSPTGSFGAWLTRIAVNEALMIRRKNLKYQRMNGYEDNAEDRGPGHSLSAPGLDPADGVVNGELVQMIESAVDRLPDDFRTVFVLRAIHQLSVKETANCLDIKEATVKSRFHRARHLMQTMLNHEFDVAGLHAFEFAGKRCDAIVDRVLERLESDST